jgi:hypothetical protein
MRPLRFALLLAALASPAVADEPDARVAGANALFREGDQLLRAGKAREACEKFAESQKLDPALGTLINLAICHARDGKTGTAWGEYTEALAQAEHRGQAERVEAIKREMVDLKKRLSQVHIVDHANAEKIAVDGRPPLGPEALTAPFPLDPGTHTLEISAAGKISTKRTVTLLPGPATETLRLEPLADAPVAAAPPTPRAASAPPEGERVPKRTLGLVVGGVGLVAVGVGTYFGIAAIGKKGDADKGCNGFPCTRDGLDASDAAHTDATISTVCFGVGLAAIAVGSFLFFTAKPAHGKNARLHVAPSFGRGGGALEASGAW